MSFRRRTPSRRRFSWRSSPDRCNGRFGSEAEVSRQPLFLPLGRRPLLYSRTAQHELDRHIPFMACVFKHLVLIVAREWKPHGPLLLVHRWIIDGHLIIDGVRTDARETFDDMQGCRVRYAKKTTRNTVR